MQCTENIIQDTGSEESIKCTQDTVQYTRTLPITFKNLKQVFHVSNIHISRVTQQVEVKM